jgi:hypothetical protein
MQRFYVALLFLTLLMCGAVEVGYQQAWFNRPSFAWEIIVILALFTGFIFFKLNKTQSQNFAQIYLLTIVLKILFGGILIAFILFMDAQMAVENALVFIISYLLFTSLEVFFLFRKINKTPKANG